jgi:hypothetical protein
MLNQNYVRAERRKQHNFSYRAKDNEAGMVEFTLSDKKLNNEDRSYWEQSLLKQNLMISIPNSKIKWYVNNFFK